MPFSYKDYTGDGSTTTFSITFDYQAESEISVTVDGVAQSGFTFPSSTQVQLTTAPSSNALVRVRRTTDLDEREVDFASGSVLTEEDLDNSNIQVFHAAQEAIDTANDAISLDDDDKWDANSKVIKNVADPVNDDDAVNKTYLEDTWLTTADKAQLNSLDLDNLDDVADDIANVNTVAGSISNVNTTAGSISNVNTVAGSISNVNTVAARDANIGTVASRDADIGTVASRDADIGTVADRDADIGTVADDLDLASPKIVTVANNIANVNTVAGVSSNVTTVAGISADVTSVAGDATDIGKVAAIDSDVTSVAAIDSNVTTVAGIASNVTTVAGNNANVTTVAGVSSDVTTVAGISANVTTVANDGTDIGTVAGISSDVSTVAGISSDVSTVAGISADVTTAATNAADITAVADEVSKVISVANDLAEATSEIDVVAGSIANVDLVGGSIANVNSVASNLADVNSFADTYFISATAPSSPTIGDLWFDTTNDVMKVYSSGGFINAGSGFLPLTGGTLTGTLTLDGAPTSNLHAATKAYVDAINTDLVNDTSPQLGANLSSNGNNIQFADNDKAQFGAGSDLQIYHTGSHSYIDESGTGNLYLSSNGAGVLVTGGGETQARFLKDGAVELYHDNSKKFETTSTGVDVTGRITTDGITEDTSGNVGIGTSSPNGKLDFSLSTNARGYFADNISEVGSGNLALQAVNSAGSALKPFGIRAEDIRFATGNSERLRLTSSGNVGIGTSSPNVPLEVNGETRIYPSSGAGVLRFGSGGSEKGKLTVDASSNMVFETAGTERVRIKSDGTLAKAPLNTPLKIDQFNLANPGTQYSTTSTSYANTVSFTYSPQSSNSKIIMIAHVNFWADVDNDGHGSVLAQLRLQTTQSSTTTERYQGESNKLNQGGQSRYQCVPVQVEFNNSSTDNITFQWSHRRSSGSRTVVTGGAAGIRVTIIEVQR